MPFEPEPGAFVGGKYQLERRLAGGGMGTVWIARHTALDAQVAVKFMAKELATTSAALARFEREAKASAQLASTHIVRVHDFGVEDGAPYMVMELLEGEDLGQRLDGAPPMSLAEVLALAVPIGKALRAAHEAGLVHRDLKPRNVFIAREGDEEVVKLLDFGIARETANTAGDDLTSSGLVLGSPFHMPPEQAKGERADARADLWALGVVLYRALTGRRPFDADNQTVLLLRICTQPHPPATSLRPDLPPAIDAFFDKALAKEPDARFRTARELVDALRALVVDAPGANLGGLDHTPSSVPRLSTPVREPVFGRTDPTVTKLTSLREPHVGSREADASRSGALQAVETTSAAVVQRRRLLPILAAVLGACGAVLALVTLRGETSTGAPSPAATQEVPTADASATASAVASAPPPEVAPMAAASRPSAEGASAAPPPEVPPSSLRPRGPVAPPRPAGTPRPMKAPKLDPFTGLPAEP